MSVSSEHLVLGGLVQSPDFIRDVIPYVEEDYFHDQAEQAVFLTIKKFVTEYSAPPKRTSLLHEIAEDDKIADSVRSRAIDLVAEIYDINIPELDHKWLTKQAESFCQNKAIYNAIQKAIGIYDGTERTMTPHAIPDILKTAIGISFDTAIGKDLFEDVEARFDYYNSPENRLQFDIDVLNRITSGGCPRKTLNVLVAGVNVGKTMGMAHLAAAYIKQGLNVLYISMEMSEFEILKRIDANILKTPIQDIGKLPRETFLNKIQKIKEKTHGKLKVKEFPPGAGTAAHFKHVIGELKLKQNFVPDILMIDYLGITGSSRIKMGQHNSYTYLKAVAEELRALAVETETVLWTAMQLNRQGIQSSDVEITDVSDSMGVPATADFMLSMSRTEEMDELGQILVKQLKNRYGNKTNEMRFALGVNVDTQTMYDVNQSETDDLVSNKIRKSGADTQSVTPTGSLKDKFASFKFE
jgi:replicative DNA helicase